MEEKKEKKRMDLRFANLLQWQTIKQAAKQNGRSMNNEILYRLFKDEKNKAELLG